MTCMYKGVDYTGKISGCYEVLGFDSIKVFPGGQKRQHWKVRCIKCNNIKVLSWDKIIGKHQSGCAKCVRTRFGGSKSWHWNNTKVENVPANYMHAIEGSAKKRKNIPVNISREYIDKLFQKQKGKCAYTGYDLWFSKKGILGTASLDRIDSSKGYIEGNVQWVHKDVNVIKWNLSHEKFLEICKLITENNKND